jgi:hypothetical protein
VFVIDRAHFGEAIGDPERAKLAAEQREQAPENSSPRTGSAAPTSLTSINF